MNNNSSRAVEYSATMLRAMLGALTCQDSEGRYQVLTRGSTLETLDARGAVVREDGRDIHVRPVTRWYLSPATVTTLRSGLVLMMGGRHDVPVVYREFVRSDPRAAQAAARLILGDIEGSAAVTTARAEDGARTEHLSAAGTVARLADLLSNGQPVHEHGTGDHGGRPAERLVAHLGGGAGAVLDFRIKRPTVGVEKVLYARHTGAHGLGWARRVSEENPASVRATLAAARRAGRGITVNESGVICVERGGIADPGQDGAGEACPVWFVPQRPAAEEQEHTGKAAGSTTNVPERSGRGAVAQRDDEGTEERTSPAALSSRGREPRAPRMVATCCSCGAGIEMPMDGPRPACTHDGETRPDGGIVIAGTVVRPADPGTCNTDRHLVRDVPRWTSGNYVPRCGECVAAGLGVKMEALPGFTQDRAAVPTVPLTAAEVSLAANGCTNQDDDGCTDHRYKIHFERGGAFDSYDNEPDARDALNVLVARHIEDNEGQDCEGCGSPRTEHGYWIEDAWPPAAPKDRT